MSEIFANKTKRCQKFHVAYYDFLKPASLKLVEVESYAVNVCDQSQ